MDIIDDSFNLEIITLPTIDRDGQIEALSRMGLSNEDSERYSRESGRDITILKKLIGFPSNKAKWLNPENIKEFLPVLLIGRWDEQFVGDKEIIEKITGVSYDAYLPILKKWRDVENSPLLQIGDTWRLTSPLDAWTTLSSFLTKGDFKILNECFDLLLKNGNPLVNPTDETTKLLFAYNKQRRYSNWIREGIVQSLILVGIYGESLKMNTPYSSQIWVDNLIQSLLKDGTGELWISLNNQMPLIAEASPNSFLDAVENSLVKELPPLMEMFIEEDGLLDKTSHHTGLLWALEGLAWMPEYLFRASSILLKLSSLDPGGRLSNRPINSLYEIFKPWHYQTLATYEERIEILKQITAKEREYGWNLLIGMLPSDHGVAHPTHKMRWRTFNLKTNITYTRNEIWDTHSKVVNIILSLFDYTEDKFATLIKESVKLSQKDRDNVLSFFENEYSKISQNQYTAWHEIRKILSHHRSFPSMAWALNEDVLVRYESLYNKLEPTDTIQKYLWLFNEHWPEFKEGFVYEEDATISRHDQQERQIDTVRIEGLKEIITQFGLEKAIELSTIVKEAWILGDTLARIIANEEDEMLILESLRKEGGNLFFVQSFVTRKVLLNNISWAFRLFEKMRDCGFNNDSLAKMLLPIYPTKELWDFVDQTSEEIKKEYWLKMYPNFYSLSSEEKVLGLTNLLMYKRFYSAIDVASHNANEIPTELLVSILQKSATEEANETVRLRGYEITQIFDAIDKREDIEHTTLINLEWLFLPVLANYGSYRSPKILHKELATNPLFFIEVLKYVYLPQNKDLIVEERKGLSDELIKNRAEQAFKLFYSWETIPGVNSDNSIDEAFLNQWVETVRTLAKEADRLEVADIQIGEVLAQYPEKDFPNWPPDAICKLIESINTDSIKNNFATAVFNKRGSSTRAIFAGGDIERGHARYFEELAKKHRYAYPNISAIFSRLSKGYLLDAKRQDESAEREKLEY